MDIYFVIGTILSIILSYWGVWHANKSKAQVGLALVDVSWIPLVGVFNDESQQLDRLNYKLPFTSNQYYYAGTIINTGNTDIHKSLIFKPVTVSIDSDFKVVSFNLLEASEVNATCTQQGHDLVLEWDILKPLEKFTFELIIESPSTHKLFGIGKSLRVNSRIADLSDVSRMELDEIDSFKKEFFNTYLPTYAYLIFVFAIGFYLLFVGISSFYTPRNTLTYEVVSQLTNEPISVKYLTKDSLELNYGTQTEKIPVKSLNDKVYVKPEIGIEKDRYWLVAIGLVITLFILIAVYKNLKDILQTNRLREIYTALQSELP